MSRTQRTPKKRTIESDGSIGDILVRLREDFISQKLFFIRDIRIMSNELMEKDIELLTNLRKKTNTESQKFMDFFYFDKFLVIGTNSRSSFIELVKSLVPSNHPRPLDITKNFIHIGKKVIVKTSKKKILFRIDSLEDAKAYIKKWVFHTRKNNLLNPALTPEAVVDDFYHFGNNISSLKRPKKETARKPQPKHQKKGVQKGQKRKAKTTKTKINKK